MVPVRQKFPELPPLDVVAELARELRPVLRGLRPGARVAVAVGSRGIAGLDTIVRTTIGLLREAGAAPFILPAMGSHGGATPEGQTEVLATYGITEAAMGAPVRASLEVRQIGVLAEGVPVFCSVEAMAADGVVVINRVKPHTDFFSDTLGSGLLKMCVVGLGKQIGAATMHGAAQRYGYEPMIRGIARVIEREAPILCGVAILEDQRHRTARVAVVPRGEFEPGEARLYGEARRLLPLLPFEEIDVLIVDRLGKNISGAGMDPNVIGRTVHGYTSELGRMGRRAPFIRRIFLRELTPESEGNAIGLGMADVTTTRLVAAINQRKMSINALTSLTPQSAKIPIHFDTDREAIGRTIASVALSDPAAVRAVRIASTLEVEWLQVSEAMLPEVRARGDLAVEGEPEPMTFGADGNLVEFPAAARQRNHHG